MEFSTYADMVDVTSLSRPDETWEHIDQQGHRHRWEFADGSRVYNPRVTATLPTLRYVIDDTWIDEDGDERTVGHHECITCGEHVDPRRTADTCRQFVPGLLHCFVDGKPVSLEDFQRLVEEHKDDAATDQA